MIFTKIFYLFIFCASLSIQCNLLLQAPQTISSEQIQILEQKWFTIFSWKFPFQCNVTFAYHDQKAGFTIQCCKMPLYWRNFETIKNSMQECLFAQEFCKQYYFAQPLKHHDPQHPKQIDIHDLVALIKTKKCIFYTGAGISAGSVATMNGLMNDLEIQHGFWHFCKQTWKNSNKITQAFESFCRSAIYQAPSQAHIALRDIACAQSMTIITENVDLLHQRSGIEPILTALQKLHDITPDQLQNIDCIICIGLSHDDRGFLNYFKTCNTDGKIIALDLAQPDYVSNQDFLMQDNIQTIIPELAQT